MRYLIAAALAFAVSQPALAGPLTPPGAPAPTHKTLTEVEPRTAINATNTPGDASHVYIISQSGSYYLTEDIVTAGTVSGIRIEADQVQLDLSGFTIRGPGNLPPNAGIVSTAVSGIHIMNGFVSGYSTCVDLSLATVIRADSLSMSSGGQGMTTGGDAHISNCDVYSTNNGYEINGRGNLIESSIARCGLYGFWFTGSTTATSCVANGGIRGFIIAPDSDGSTMLLENCRSEGNFTSGFEASTSGGSQYVIFRGCVAARTSGYGFFTFIPAKFEDCIAVENTYSGFYCSDASLLTSCSAINNMSAGVFVYRGSTLKDCVIEGNENGIWMNDGTLIKDCTIRNNTQRGIYAEDTATGEDDGQIRIDGCVIDSNAWAGIVTEDQTLITNNQISRNGTDVGYADRAGILILSTGKGSRIDSNSLVSNGGFAIRLKANRNIVVRNNFMLNGANIEDPTLDNKITPILGDPTLMGPWDNFAH
jgi:hypothetical protein